MPRKTVTALRAEGRGRVLVELDGEPWRTLPLEAVGRAGLAVGDELDRPRARMLRRELRRAEALGRATRALRVRDLPTAALEDRLARSGIARAAREETLETLSRAGIVDDRRFATGRARALAERGYGDAAIRWRLERDGAAAEAAAGAVSALEPEPERARRIADRRGRCAATAGWLARRGFAEESVEAAAAE